eukprot:scaffold1562_cov170-Amphora_coffeaeformis.AAC.4
MVLVLAALYYYNQHLQQQQQEQGAEPEACPPTADTKKTSPDKDLPSVTATASTTTTFAASWQEDLSQHLEQIHRVGSSLVETTIGSCTSPNNTANDAMMESRMTSGLESEATSVTTTESKSQFTRSQYTRSQITEEDEDDDATGYYTTPDAGGVAVWTTPAHVRDAWIDAVFGETFPEQRGRGLVQGFQPYSAFAATVKLPSSKEQKLGLTLSRLPLGLYVRHVQPQSEAALAGIDVDSVLVSINGMALLAEPSKQALERLWQYQGCLKRGDDVDEAGDPTMLEPVALRFWKTGRGDYTVLLFSPPPYGINWAPCGNFALVKRAYGAAADAGITRGALVASVQGESLRVMDHTSTAEALRTLQESGERTISVVLAVPPPDMRTGYHERKNNPESPPNQAAPVTAPPTARRTIKTDDGVEVKFHSLEFSLFSNFVCQTAVGACMDPSDPRESLTELAERVAAGRLEEPNDRQGYRTSRVVAPCPLLPDLLAHWNPLESLLYCVQMHQVQYHVEKYNPQHTKSPLHVLRALLETTPHATDLTMTFLLQFLAVICTPVPALDSANMEEKKTDETDIQQAKELTSLLLKLSRRDEGYCQRLYFLLRSFISSLETRRPAAGSKNLMALMNCLELLRFAEKELSVGPHVTASSLTSATSGSPSDDKKRVLPFRCKKKTLNKPKQRSDVTTSASMPDMSNPINLSTPRSVVTSYSAIERPREHALSQSPSVMYEHMSDFLTQLDRICGTVERSLQKSFRQKIADWAMQPWSASKDTALANVTKVMRESLATAADSMLLVNPVESSELLSAVDTEECYILPSAHFPILLTFDVSERRSSDCPVGEERIYRTAVELIQLQHTEKFLSDSYVVHAAVAGKIVVSDGSRCIDTETTKHSWFSGNKLVFDSRSSWGAPQTLSLRVAPKAECATAEEVSFGWVDLQPCWEKVMDSEGSYTVRTSIALRDPREQMFDEQGYLPDDYQPAVTLELKVKTECVEFDEAGGFSRKRMLLYKHDDDLRQEAFAVQFIRTCDRILQTAGLDLKLLTFQCVPVGTRRGFVEWVPGSVPLSEVCQPFLGSILDSNDRVGANTDGRGSPSMFAKAGLTKYESLRRLGGQQSESFQRLAGGQVGKRGDFSNNPVADYLRSVAYDPDAPYLIRRDVMDTYVKSCAGYSVITYILGVGDRHLDNLLLHQSGAFFHCDYSFLLGSDPKKYVPLRITEDIVHGMGGVESDNYAKFLSLASAAFLTLRRPEIVRVLLSMIRLMETSSLPDITENQPIEQAILGVRERLRLDLSPDEAVVYMEELVESSLNSKIWIAVDAIHNLGKKF